MYLRAGNLGIDVVQGFTSATHPTGGRWDCASGCDETVWEDLAARTGMAGAPVARARQVHGNGVLVVSEGGPHGSADALITRTPGLLVGVRTADCVPILVSGDGVVAAVHAGWRGVVAGVVGAALAQMGDPGKLRAAIGPCISVDHYEVGPEVVAGITSSGVPARVFVDRSRGPRPHVDLRAAVLWQLEAAGCRNIVVVPVCTFADRRMHSHRRSGPAAGRQISVIGLRP